MRVHAVADALDWSIGMAREQGLSTGDYVA